MSLLLASLRGGFTAEFVQLRRSHLFLALTIIQAVTFLLLVSLFGLTGSQAPTAIVLQDQGADGRALVEQLSHTHHSFALRSMNQATASAAIQRGNLVAIITIPRDFSVAITQGNMTTLQVTVDNVNTDMTDDIQRALPAAVVALARQLHLPNVHVQVAEHDLVNHDTGFIPYLVVSGLALDAFVVASILSAMAVAREFETGTVKLLAIAPVHPLFSLLGRVLAADVMATLAMLFPLAVTILGYQILPLHPLEVVGAIVLSCALFSCIGTALGVALKRTLPVVSLVFGLSLPLYICSNSLEPQRFDGNLIWLLAHISPVYYAVAILEQAFHGLQVTPESTQLNVLILSGWTLVMLVCVTLLLHTALTEKSIASATPRVSTPRLLSRLTTAWQTGQIRWRVLATSCLLVVITSMFVNVHTWFALQDQIASPSASMQNTTSPDSDDQQQETLLANYINQISDLLIHNHLLQTRNDDPARITANAITRATLNQLTPARKVALLRFLYQTKLIDNDYHIITFDQDNLQSLPLSNTDLRDGDLSGGDFQRADMQHVNLSYSVLTHANFRDANLAGIDLRGTDMRHVILTNANLAGANLTGVVGLSDSDLGQASSLAGATLPNGSALPGTENDNDD